MLGRLPLVEQLDGLRSGLGRNQVLTEVLTRAATLELPGWYVTAGCLFKTVWNVISGRPPADGIKDYDLFYFDGTDLSWEAEDAVIKAGQEVFAGLPTEWRSARRPACASGTSRSSGRPARRTISTEAAIDCFTATTCCLGVHLEPGGEWRVYAPHGLSDVFNLVGRPNPVLAPRAKSSSQRLTMQKG